MMMMSSQTSHLGGSISRIMTSSLIVSLSLISLSCVVGPVTSFLLPRQLSIQHQPSIYSPINNLETQRSSLLYQSSNSQDGETATAETPASSAAAGTSKRAQRKASQRAKKQRQQKSQSTNVNKATSQHPEAILKRQRQRQNGNNNHATNNKRRNHNFAQRAEYLSEGTDNDYGFTDNLDRLTLTSGIPDNTANNSNNNNIQLHQLHSQRVSKLDEKTTADDVVKAIKRAQNLHDEHDVVEIAHFLLEEVDQSFAYGYRGSLLSRLAVASLHLQNYDIAKRCIIERRISHRSSMLPLESAAIVRGLLRCHRTEEAWEVLEDELSLPLEGSVQWENSDENSTQKKNDLNGDDELLHLEDESIRRRLAARDKLIHRARSISSIASRHFYEMEPTEGIKAVGKLKEMGGVVNEAGLTADDLGIPWDRLVKGAASCESKRRDGKWDNAVEGEDAASSAEIPSSWPCNIVYAVLDAMIAFPSENKDVTFEALCNALVRRTVFVTGAVDMEGCPEADRGEVAFIGRSNVGKSSLVNMLTNRKSLAFTSKTPGKTQQFNYFAVNDKPELARQIRYGDDVPGEKDRDSFYIVDLPGFGFAKVTQQLRQQWSDFMDEYLQERETLQAVFHLIDARHGPTDEDSKIMQKVGTILGAKQQAKEHCAKYIIILTKADKNVKNAKSQSNPGKVSNKVMEKLIETMKENRVGYAPIVLTSSETRLGRDEVWKYLRFAAER
mmetsp:Transcript_3806/g.6352  ORF Transcript_3806/g.6352 Transcript_3806/m.6352 type:complete len:726 (-) Transcript_3806:100-2277(-)